MHAISEVIFRTYIHDDTEDKISAAMEESPDLLIEVIDALKEQELRQQEAAALTRAIESSAKNNGRPVTPPPPYGKLVLSACHLPINIPSSFPTAELIRGEITAFNFIHGETPLEYS